ncbi:MAG: DUF559 domain-containing protein [Clostridia bacterium]|nr:DUF559 domain-containing protein [Clostridia bacterium]
MTPEEKHLWYDFLKLLPITVRRQMVIECYIVDFCIPSHKIIIELGGKQHQTPEGINTDQARDAFFRENGFVVLRYPNSLIHDRFHFVCSDIQRHIHSEVIE